MSGVAVGAAVAGGLVVNAGNKDAADAAADQTPEFAKVLNPSIKQQLGRVEDTNVASFGGDRVADFSANQQTGLDMSSALAQVLGQQAATSGTGFEQFASGANVGTNPFLEQDLQAQRELAFRDLQRNQLPGIRNNAVASGGIGGTRQGIAEGVAISDLNQNLLQQDAAQRGDQRNQDLSQQLQALINQGNILSGQEAGQNQLLRTGAIEQGQAQQEIGGEREAFNEQNIDQFNRDQQLLSILLGTPAQQGQLASQTSVPGAAAGSALLASQLFNQQPPPPTIPPATTLPPGGRTTSSASGGI
jgi:hypothetical protein